MPPLEKTRIHDPYNSKCQKILLHLAKILLESSQVCTMSRTLFLIFVALMCNLPILFSQTVPTEDLQHGDLLFFTAEAQNLSGAINRVTQRQAQHNYDHVALVERVSDSVYLLHATGELGTIRESYDNYRQRTAKKNKEIYIFRLKDTLQACIPVAISEAKKWLGKPYNWSYVLNDDSIYCSDLIERSFRHCGLFTLEPMTFIDPKTQKTDHYWSEFYHQLGIPVPEGQLGCNPNGLAASAQLNFVGRLL